jgi:hypothetical protein
LLLPFLRREPALSGLLSCFFHSRVQAAPPRISSSLGFARCLWAGIPLKRAASATKCCFFIRYSLCRFRARYLLALSRSPRSGQVRLRCGSRWRPRRLHPRARSSSFSIFAAAGALPSPARSATTKARRFRPCRVIRRRSRLRAPAAFFPAPCKN